MKNFKKYKNNFKNKNKILDNTKIIFMDTFIFHFLISYFIIFRSMSMNMNMNAKMPVQ